MTSGIIPIPAVLDPFHDVAMHVVKAKGVGSITANRVNLPLLIVQIPKQSVQEIAVESKFVGLPGQLGKLHPSVEDNNRSANPIRTGSSRFMPVSIAEEYGGMGELVTSLV